MVQCTDFGHVLLSAQPLYIWFALSLPFILTVAFSHTIVPDNDTRCHRNHNKCSTHRSSFGLVISSTALFACIYQAIKSTPSHHHSRTKQTKHMILHLIAQNQIILSSVPVSVHIKQSWKCSTSHGSFASAWFITSIWCLQKPKHLSRPLLTEPHTIVETNKTTKQLSWWMDIDQFLLRRWKLSICESMCLSI